MTIKVAICDVNKVRAEFYNETLEALSQPRAAFFPTADFLEMLKTQKIDTVIVTTVDAFHDVYIVKALKAGGASPILCSAATPGSPWHKPRGDACLEGNDCGKVTY